MFKGLLRRIDEQAGLARLLSWMSTTLAVNRGLPILGGSVLTVVSCIVTGIVLPVIVNSEKLSTIWLLLCIPAFLLHLAVFMGLTGVMMSAPLGKGFKE
ncbi:MAG TPA: hypothetical protein VJZ27_05045 [Aggregatilineales bacterium]|nr:hypothetical protein [Aggregatilineales bacterium]